VCIVFAHLRLYSNDKKKKFVIKILIKFQSGKYDRLPIFYMHIKYFILQNYCDFFSANIKELIQRQSNILPLPKESKSDIEIMCESTVSSTKCSNNISKRQLYDISVIRSRKTVFS